MWECGSFKGQCIFTTTSYSEVIIIFPNFLHIKLIHRSRVLAGHDETQLCRLMLKNPWTNLPTIISPLHCSTNGMGVCTGNKLFTHQWPNTSMSLSILNIRTPLPPHTHTHTFICWRTVCYCPNIMSALLPEQELAIKLSCTSFICDISKEQ